MNDMRKLMEAVESTQSGRRVAKSDIYARGHSEAMVNLDQLLQIKDDIDQIQDTLDSMIRSIGY